MISFNTAGLPLGLHQGLISVITPDGGGTTQELAVAVNVMGLRRDPPLLSWTIPRGATISDTKPVEVWNAGSGALPFNLSADQGWLTLDPTSGQSTGPGDRVAVAVGVSGSAGFTEGTHAGQVKVTAADGEGVVLTQQVNVSVTVFSPSAPLWLRATDGLYTNMVRVEWPVVSGSTSYELRRGVLPDLGSAAPLATVAAPATVYEDLTAEAGRQYYYWVRTVNTFGYAGGYSVMDGGWRRLSPPATLAATRNDYDDKVR
ncbi:MAG: hypothetical protein LC725_05020, partial [Lentisphaerae bacterium]|nr:hypothetical protein [Lentisphaerota bacterium]